MRIQHRFLLLSVLAALLCAPLRMSSQSPSSAPGSLPEYVSFTGELKTQQQKPATGIVTATFLLYEEESGGEPLWIEHQRLTLDSDGRFTVTLGAATAGGVPMQLFSAKKAHWLAIEPDGLPMPERVLLLSVPYAFKAGDAETLGGLPASAFALAGSSRGGVIQNPGPGAAQPSAGAVSTITSNVTTSGGTVNALPLFTTGTNVESSAITQTGTGATAKIGVNTTAPATTLDVNGSAIVRGALNIASTGTATATAGKNSQQQVFSASSFNSGTVTPVLQRFVWQVKATGNNTTAASSNLDLMYASGTAVPTETGLHLSSKGLFTFAPGQTFPGTGTITGVTAGTALTGGGTSGAPTLNLDTTKVPLLLASNSFTGNQSITGNLTATGALAGTSINAAAATFTGPVTFASGQAFPGTITGVTPGPGIVASTTNGNVALSADTTFSDARYAQLGAFNIYSGLQVFNNYVGIGVIPSVYPLQVNGTMRAETGLSLGGNAALGVDSVGVIGGHFLVDGNGNVGINNPSPASALDVVGDMKATGAVIAPGGANVGNIIIGGDLAMHAAPRMYMTGYVPTPLNAFQIVRPVFSIPTRNIIITRFTVGGSNPCFGGGPEVFHLATGPNVTSLSFLETLTVSIAPNISKSDTGAIFHAIPAGQQVWVISDPMPTCPLFLGPMGDNAISVEYMMQ